MIYGSGLLGSIYGYGLNPGLIPLVLLLVRCIPCVHIVSVAPAPAVESYAPSVAVADTLPSVEVDQMAVALAVMGILAQVQVVELVPDLAVASCECPD
jgi:hypothetical protein